MRIAMTFVAALAMSAPAVMGHCGHCGVGDEKSESGGGHEHQHAEIGKPAPDFALKGVDGKEYKLADFLGKVVVLEWTNHECPVVGRYYSSKTMTATHEAFEGEPVVWLAIDSSNFCADKVDSIKKWAADKGVTYPILLDAPGEVGNMYGAKTTPHMFVIDQKGVLAYMGSLDDDKKGDKEDPRNYVEEAVAVLLDGSTVAMTETKPFGSSVKYKK